ncbi:MAG: hypothetical protein AAFU67_09295 [Bacteroidota bacterium]
MITILPQMTLLYLLFAFTSCGVEANEKDLVAMMPPDFPVDVIFQSLVYDENGGIVGYRLSINGAYEVKDAPQTGWHLALQLDAEKLKKVKTAIDASPSDGWNTNYGQTTTDDEQPVTWLQIRTTNNEERYVRVDHPNQHPDFVFNLMEALAMALQ